MRPPSDTNVPIASAWLRRYLYGTAAITGAAVLIIEILGAKMLSPYFGSSHFVWTAQIAVTLISLAVGYYLGGWLADRSPKLGWLYLCLLAGAVYLCLATLVCEPMAFLCLRFNLALGALAASMALFIVPPTLLAMTAPFLVRILTLSVSAVGRQMGRLSAISTLGSVAGTIIIGYVLIPFLPNSVTMSITAFILMALAAGYFAVWGRRQPGGSAAVAVLVVGAILGYAAIQREYNTQARDTQEIYRANSNFGLMQVVQSQKGRQRYYLNDFLTQNTYDPVEQKSLSLFTYMLYGLARAYTPNITHALCIGMGVGIVPMRLAREGVKVDVVEINPAVVPLAQQYFNFDPRLVRLVIGDGRYYLNQCRQTYDALVLDAFLGDSSPSHLLTREAFAAMRRVLKPEGVLVINSFGYFESGRSFFSASLDKTLREVFPSVLIHDGGNGNVFYVASPHSGLTMRSEPNLSQVHPYCLSMVKEAFARIRPAPSGPARVLTDDYNPVEFYDAANREQLRRLLVMSRRSWQSE